MPRGPKKFGHLAGTSRPGNRSTPLESTRRLRVSPWISHRGAWRTAHLLRQTPGRLEAVGVGEQLVQLVPVGAVIEQEPDDVRAPARPEVRISEVLERDHLVLLGTERHPQPLVLTAVDVGDGRLPDPPPDPDPGVLLTTPGQRGQHRADALHHPLGHLRSIGHTWSLPLPTYSPGCSPGARRARSSERLETSFELDVEEPGSRSTF